MLRSAIQKELNKGRQKWNWDAAQHTTRTDVWCITGIPSLYLAPATLKINAMQAMYGEDAFKPSALPYCFGTKVKQQVIPFMQIHEITGLSGGAITSILVTLT